jgi:hypothetical protein
MLSRPVTRPDGATLRACAGRRLKAEVHGFCDSQAGTWRGVNHTTQEALGRLDGARQLVR